MPLRPDSSHKRNRNIEALGLGQFVHFLYLMLNRSVLLLVLDLMSNPIQFES